MKKETLVSMAYDFVSVLIDRIPSSKMRAIYLFGSVARGDFDESSDIDIFIDTTFPIEKVSQEALKSFGTTQRMRWHPKGVKQDIKLICGNLESATWKELLSEIQDHGLTLYGPATHRQDKNHLLVTYELNKLPQPQKMKLVRQLYGYSTKKQGVLYEHKGFVDINSGLKLASNVFLIPMTQKKETEGLLNKFKVPYQMRKIVF